MSLVPAEDFPAARNCTYLNSASVALMYKGADQAAAAWHEDVAEFGTLHFDEEAEDRVFDTVRAAFAGLIGAAPDDVAVASSATELIASLAWAVMPAAERNIVVADVVFPSTAYPWARVARHTGAEMRWVAARDAQVDEADILAAIDDRTAVVCLSHVEYGGGQIYDLARIAAAAHAKGALLVIDATQSAGAVPIDVGAAQVDALISGSYKWLCGPFGVGLLYLAPHLRSLDPGLVGWRSNSAIYDLRADRVVYADTARRFEFSTMAYGSAVGLASSIDYLKGIGVERIQAHNLSVARSMLDRLDRLGATIVSPRDGRERSSIVSARFPGFAPKEVVQHLQRDGIVVSPRRDFVRFSFHLYNDEADVDRAAESLRRLLAGRVSS